MGISQMADRVGVVEILADGLYRCVVASEGRRIKIVARAVDCAVKLVGAALHWPVVGIRIRRRNVSFAAHHRKVSGGLEDFGDGGGICG